MESVQAGIADAESLIEQRQKDATLQERYAAATPLLDAVTDPAWRAVLDHHQRDVAWEGSDEFSCYGCDGGCHCDSAKWPCTTVRLAAKHLGIDLPEDTWMTMQRPADGSLDPKETQ
jgi:hypothetical protein